MEYTKWWFVNTGLFGATIGEYIKKQIEIGNNNMSRQCVHEYIRLINRLKNRVATIKFTVEKRKTYSLVVKRLDKSK